MNAEIEYTAVTDDGYYEPQYSKACGTISKKTVPIVAGLLPRRRSPSVAPKHTISRSVHGIPRQNILQLLPDATAPSKEELASYWKKVAKRALVHFAGRPLKLARHTHGITFYHRGKLPEIPATVHQLRIHKRESGEGVRVWVDNLDGLIGLVDMDAVELHPWNATVDDIERADRIVIDLDPVKGIEWAALVETALVLRDLLRADGLKPWPKVTGGKGLHVMASLIESMSHDGARYYAHHLMQKLVDKKPELYVLSASTSGRKERIFLRLSS